MSDEAFDEIEQVLRSGGSEAGFDFLARKFREEKNYPLLFEARLMQKRRELGLPLIRIELPEDLPVETRRGYEEAYVQVAREVGSLFLADGDIPRAWPYFRAIGETAPVASAIEPLEPRDGMDAIIEIAFYERVHPRKGFELILANYGMCRAISYFEQFPGREGRDASLRLLVRTLHHDLAARLKRAIAAQEGAEPETESIPDLIAGRDWLFGQYDYYIDTSHLVSVIRFSVEASDRETLAMALELTEYGRRLSSMFQYRGEPPFEDTHVDYGLYLRALLGEDLDAAVAHFRGKLPEGDPKEAVSGPAQVLVGLLARLGRHAEAIEVSLRHLAHVDPNQLACPSVPQLCQMAGDYGRLMKLAREQGDLLSFTAASIQL